MVCSSGAMSRASGRQSGATRSMRGVGSAPLAAEQMTSFTRKKMARRGKRFKISLSGAPGKGEILKGLIKLVVPAALLTSACGATVGDACTTASDCGNQLCINQAWTLGGYCSKPCTTGDDSTCPSGSTCIAGGNGANS